MDQSGHSKSTEMELFTDRVRRGLGPTSCDLIMGESGVSIHKATSMRDVNMEDAHPKVKAIIS